MKQLSAARLKGQKVRSQHVTPEEGSMLRTAYDYFVANKGLPVEFDGSTKLNSSILRQLRDFYGLDIRRLGKAKFCFCGEYVERGVYIDYIAERLKL